MSLLTDESEKRPVLSTQSALLVVDVQQYTSSQNEGCHYFADRFPSAITNINKIATEFRKLPTFEVVFTFLRALTTDRRDVPFSNRYSPSEPSLSNIPGPKDDVIFLDSCMPSGSDILIPKTSCSVFQSTNIHYVLTNLGIRHLVIVGQLTDECITSAARDAADLGYFVTVVADACTARSAADEERGHLNVAGCARLVDTATVLEEAQNAKPPEYELLCNVVSFLKDKGYADASRVVAEAFCNEEADTMKNETMKNEEPTNETVASSLDSIIDVLVQSPVTKVPCASEEEKTPKIPTNATQSEVNDYVAVESPRAITSYVDETKSPEKTQESTGSEEMTPNTSMNETTEIPMDEPQDHAQGLPPKVAVQDPNEPEPVVLHENPKAAAKIIEEKKEMPSHRPPTVAVQDPNEPESLVLHENPKAEVRIIEEKEEIPSHDSEVMVESDPLQSEDDALTEKKIDLGEDDVVVPSDAVEAVTEQHVGQSEKAVALADPPASTCEEPAEKEIDQEDENGYADIDPIAFELEEAKKKYEMGVEHVREVTDEDDVPLVVGSSQSVLSCLTEMDPPVGTRGVEKEGETTAPSLPSAVPEDTTGSASSPKSDSKKENAIPGSHSETHKSKDAKELSKEGPEDAKVLHPTTSTSEATKESPMMDTTEETEVTMEDVPEDSSMMQQKEKSVLGLAALLRRGSRSENKKKETKQRSSRPLRPVRDPPAKKQEAKSFISTQFL